MPHVPLPIDPLLPEVVATLRRANALVLEAPPGAGKTTRVPRALLESGLLGNKEILVLQPRRLPARLAAQWVSGELGERLGESVGYQMRFDDVGGPKTRLKFVTEGILMRRLLSDPQLAKVGAVLLDEFHERHLHGDLGLALLKRLQQSARADLKLVVMSATLDASPIAAFLDGCPVLKSEGRRFEVAMEHLATPDARPLDQQVLAALKRVAQSGTTGDILVFLPGASEIRRAKTTCEPFTRERGWELHLLHGELPAAEQDRAIQSSRVTKVILSTNVAESSVTIPGVACVIDSGWARLPSYSPWSGLSRLMLSKVSKASAIQRAGRAGRTGPGKCLRLYTREDFENRPEHETPEIRRLDFSESLLTLKGMGLSDLATFPFFEPPSEAALTAAQTLLLRLQAIDASGGLTELGHRLLTLPLHPRLARVLAEAEKRGIGASGALAVALIAERDIRKEVRPQLGSRQSPAAGPNGPSDVLELIERFEQAAQEKFADDALRRLQLDRSAVHGTRKALKQLLGSVRHSRTPVSDRAAQEEALLLSILTGYPDRVARRRRPHAPEIVLTGGKTATLSPQSVVQSAPFLVAIDADEGQGSRVSVVRLASLVEPEWLLGLYPERLSEIDAVSWNAQTFRVERLTRLSYDDLPLEETRTLAVPSPEASQLLAQHAAAALVSGGLKWSDADESNAWQERLGLAAKLFPEMHFPEPNERFLHEALLRACEGKRGFDELSDIRLGDAFSGLLSSQQNAFLSRMLPTRVTLPGGRQVTVQYEPGKSPWIQSRLQDFFGMATTPSLAGGKVSLVIHLLAPNQRAVQVTSDLSGFWERHYPGVRKELMRKYPRHSWPEDPLHAQPSPPISRRR